MRVRLAKGSLELENAFAYRGQRLKIARRKGDAESVEEMRPGVKNQFTLEIEHFAECILNDLTPKTPGEEGLQDQRIVEAIYESARTGRAVKIAAPAGPTRGPEPDEENF